MRQLGSFQELLDIPVGSILWIKHFISLNGGSLAHQGFAVKHPIEVNKIEAMKKINQIGCAFVMKFDENRSGVSYKVFDDDTEVRLAFATESDANIIFSESWGDYEVFVLEPDEVAFVVCSLMRQVQTSYDRAKATLGGEFGVFSNFRELLLEKSIRRQLGAGDTIAIMGEH